MGIKYNYFGLCYKTILHLDGTVVQLQILLQFQDFARPDDELFLCLYTKIYQHMTYRRPNANPLTTQIGMVKTILYIYIDIYIYIYIYIFFGLKLKLTIFIAIITMQIEMVCRIKVKNLF